MSNNFTQNENLLRYLDDELPPEEKFLMEQEINKTEHLREELLDLKLSKYAVSYLGIRESVKEAHTVFQNKMKQELIKPSNKNIKWVATLAVAASVALILFLFVFNNKTKPEDDLYAANFRNFEISISRGAENNNIATLYTEKKFSAIIGLLENEERLTIKEQFLKAMSYFQLNQQNKGNLLLQKVLTANLEQNTITYKDEAEYYLGMSYLKQKQYAKAIQILEPIAGNKNHNYSDIITTTLIDKLKKLN